MTANDYNEMLANYLSTARRFRVLWDARDARGQWPTNYTHWRAHKYMERIDR